MTDRSRESDPTDRPSDAVTGKVVARWMSWSRGCVPVKPGLAREKIVAFMEGTGDPNDECLGSVGDPRSDTDTVLELLHAIGVSIDPGMSENHWWTPTNRVPRGSLTESKWRSLEYLPISGEPFRYGVVHLAARMWGIEE